MAVTPREARPPRAPRIVGPLSRGGAVAARWAHNPKVGGSNPPPATNSAAVPTWDRRFGVSGVSRLGRLRIAVADLFFPPLCAGCDERGTWLCGRCFASIRDESLSGFAAMWVPIASGRCVCSTLHPKVTRAVSAYPYAGWVAQSVIGAKYGGEKDRARFLGAVLAGSLASEGIEQADIVVPVPMFKRKQLERGYNQAELMAETACAMLGAPAPASLLVQHESRPSQVGLSARDRRRNVRGSFSLNPEHVLSTGARIALVDDVRTTGATMSACVEALRALRPRRIDVVTVAVELPREMMEDLGLAVLASVHAERNWPLRGAPSDPRRGHHRGSERRRRVAVRTRSIRCAMPVKGPHAGECRDRNLVGGVYTVVGESRRAGLGAMRSAGNRATSGCSSASRRSRASRAASRKRQAARPVSAYGSCRRNRGCKLRVCCRPRTPPASE